MARPAVTGGNVRELRTLARDWNAFGKTDPLFGILSDPTKIGGKWDVDEFFDSGSAHVRKLVDTLASLNISYGTGACLDFGCGVGRLTVPLSAHFDRTVGVDVAPSMVARARQFHRFRTRCEFVVNRSADLDQFAAGTFDLVHSCLVLQHIVPEISLGYVREFFRVSKAGGLVVFQLPAETRSEGDLTAMYALAEGGHAARIVLLDMPPSLRPSETVTVRMAVTNESAVAWAHDIPAGRHICVANHWLREDGTTVVFDDGRARLPQTIAPGASVELALTVTAPPGAGRYVLEVDLVQERICWFAQNGSATARLTVAVGDPLGPGRAELPAADRPAGSASPSRTSSDARGQAPGSTLLGRIVARLRPPRRPSFSMYAVPRPEVEAVIRESGGHLLEAVDDNAAGAGWRSFTYVCRAGAGGAPGTRSTP